MIPASEEYIEEGEKFLSLVDEYKNISVQPTTGYTSIEDLQQRLDNSRKSMRKMRQQYNVILDTLEITEDKLKASKFWFKQRQAYFDWQLVHSADLDSILSNNEFDNILKIQDALIFGDIMKENIYKLSDAHFKQLIYALQFIAQYWIHQCKDIANTLDSKHESQIQMNQEVSMIDLRIKEEEENLREFNFNRTKEVQTCQQGQGQGWWQGWAAPTYHPWPPLVGSPPFAYFSYPSHITKNGNYLTYYLNSEDSLAYKYYAGDTYVEDLEGVKKQILDNKQKIQEIRQEARALRCVPSSTILTQCAQCSKPPWEERISRKKLFRGIKQSMEDFENRVWDRYLDRRNKRQDYVLGTTWLEYEDEKTDMQYSYRGLHNRNNLSMHKKSRM